MLILKDRSIEFPNQISPIRVGVDYEIATTSPAALNTSNLRFPSLREAVYKLLFFIPALRNALSETVTVMDIFVSNIPDAGKQH